MIFDFGFYYIDIPTRDAYCAIFLRELVAKVTAKPKDFFQRQREPEARHRSPFAPVFRPPLSFSKARPRLIRWRNA